MYTLRLAFKPGELNRLRSLLKVASNIKTFDQPMGVAVAQGNRSLVERTPKRQGMLRRAWNKGLKKLGNLKYRIENDRKYALFVEDGTGLFGPLKRRIYPKRSKVLRWKEGGITIFARSTKGMKPVKMLERSIPEFGDRVVASLRETMRKIAGGTI